VKRDACAFLLGAKDDDSNSDYFISSSGPGTELSSQVPRLFSEWRTADSSASADANDPHSSPKRDMEQRRGMRGGSWRTEDHKRRFRI
jgi:hypothetical protein